MEFQSRKRPQRFNRLSACGLARNCGCGIDSALRRLCVFLCKIKGILRAFHEGSTNLEPWWMFQTWTASMCCLCGLAQMRDPWRFSARMSGAWLRDFVKKEEEFASRRPFSRAFSSGRGGN